MKQLLYSKVYGRREGDTSGTEWMFDWRQWLAGVFIASLPFVIGWGSWVTRMCQKAEKGEEILDTQVNVLHSRISHAESVEEADETRLEDRLWELQKRFYEKEIEKIKGSK